MLLTKTRYWFTNTLLFILLFSFITCKLTGTAAKTLAASYDTVFVQHEYWRLITCTFFHTGFTHLILNLLNIYNFGSLLEDKLAHGFVTIIYLVAAATSTGVSILLDHSLITVGASGGIFAFVGIFLLMLFYNFYKQEPNEGKLYNSITIMLTSSIFIAIYFKGVNYIAHGVGFAVGIAAFIFLMYHIKKNNNGI